MKPSFILKSSIRLDRLFTAYAKKTALIAPSGVWTFNDVRECLRTVIFNLESAGVRKGHRVALHGENSELHLYLFLASWIMDFLYIPLDFKAPLKRLIREGDVDFLITAEEVTIGGPSRRTSPRRNYAMPPSFSGKSLMAGRSLQTGIERDLHIGFDGKTPGPRPYGGQLCLQRPRHQRISQSFIGRPMACQPASVSRRRCPDLGADPPVRWRFHFAGVAERISTRPSKPIGPLFCPLSRPSSSVCWTTRRWLPFFGRAG